MNDLDFKLYSVILTVGPTNSGKSYYTKRLAQELLAKGYRVTLLSSDDLRRYYLGENADKYDDRMMQISKKAFDDLHNRIDTACAYPYPAHFVIVDTTGLSTDFRDKVVKQARANHYSTGMLIFDYKKISDYVKHCEPGTENKRLISKHLERLRTDVYANLNKKDFDRIHRIKNKNFDDYQFVIDAADRQLKIMSTFTSRDVVDVVGDIHGCFDEFMVLLKRLGYEVNDGKLTHRNNNVLVLCGDLIDKGPKSVEVVDFVYNNLDRIFVVKGNHENFVHKSLNGELDDTGMEPEIQREYFDTSFITDPIFKAQLDGIVHASTPFLQNDRLIVTHAPCQAKYLGKTDRYSIKQQVNQRFPRRETDEADESYAKRLEEHFSHLKTEGERSFPYHVFGHVALASIMTRGSKIGIDSGCVNGGQLSAVTIPPRGRPSFTSVDCFQKGGYKPEKLVEIFKNERIARMADEANLDHWELRRINAVLTQKVNFISGTMAPADADATTLSIESLDKCFDYYTKCGVTKLIMQVKHMGSRCNVYLYKDPTKCFAVSRNGFVIRSVEKGGPDMTKVYAKLQAKFNLTDNELLILDGELMPWAALGQGLIEEHFVPVRVGVETELTRLEELGFEKVFAETTNGNEEFITYCLERNSLKKEELQKKYGQAKSGSFSVLYNYSHKAISQLKEYLQIFKDQIEVFGAPGEPDFNPFAILKRVIDGQEQVLAHDNTLHGLISDHLWITIDPTSELDRARAKQMWDYVTKTMKMEGVVVKPEVYERKSAPYIKVRSPNYLTIVYGYDYMHADKLPKLIAQKRVNSKTRTSISEFNIGLEMLATPQAEITQQNKAYRNLVVKMIVEEKEEKRFDPRL